MGLVCDFCEFVSLVPLFMRGEKAKLPLGGRLRFFVGGLLMPKVCELRGFALRRLVGSANPFNHPIRESFRFGASLG